MTVFETLKSSKMISRKYNHCVEITGILSHAFLVDLTKYFFGEREFSVISTLCVSRLEIIETYSHTFLQ